MNEARPNQKSPFRPMVIVLCLVVVVPLLLCGGIVTWFVGRQAVAGKELTVRIESLQQQGIPVDNATLESLHQSITSDQNTRRWQKAAEQTQSEAFRRQAEQMPILGQASPVPPRGQPWEDEELATAFLKEHESLLETIGELANAELESQRLPLRRAIDFEGPATLLTGTQRVREFARLIALQHDVALRAGDGEQAFQSIQTVHGLRRSLEGEPLLISQLVGIALGGIANDLLRQSLASDLLSQQQLRQIGANIPPFGELLRMFRLAIKGERAILLPAFSDPSQAKMLLEMEAAAPPPVAEVLTKLRSRDGVFFLDEIEKVESLSGASIEDFRQAGKKWQTQMDAKVADASAAEKVDLLLSFLTLPNFGVVSDAFVRQAESNNLARLAINVRLFRYRFDRWPKTIGELDQINMQPKSIESAGEVPFGYRIDESGVTLWGIDRNVLEEIPGEAPMVAGPDDPNAVWVWTIPN